MGDIAEDGAIRLTEQEGICFDLQEWYFLERRGVHDHQKIRDENCIFFGPSLG